MRGKAAVEGHRALMALTPQYRISAIRYKGYRLKHSYWLGIDRCRERSSLTVILSFNFQKNCFALKEKVSEMRKKQTVNVAGKRDLDRQVAEMKDFENHLKNQVRCDISQTHEEDV